MGFWHRSFMFDAETTGKKAAWSFSTNLDSISTTAQTGGDLQGRDNGMPDNIGDLTAHRNFYSDHLRQRIAIGNSDMSRMRLLTVYRQRKMLVNGIEWR